MSTSSGGLVVLAATVDTQLFGVEARQFPHDELTARSTRNVRVGQFGNGHGGSLA